LCRYSEVAMRYSEKDKDWGAEVKENAEGMCEMCGDCGCDPHHAVKRRFLKTRWILINGVWLCRKCHSWSELNPLKFIAWFIGVRGIEIYQMLIDKAKK